MTLFYILTASLLISLVSLIGVFTLSLKKEQTDKILVFLIAVAAGTLMGGVFYHLLPEAMEELSAETVLQTTLWSFVFFLLIEKVLHWRHCHDEDCSVHSFGYMNLIGDGVHNFIDGLVIAGAFITSVPLGWATTIAIASHEIPQEIGDFGVLLHAGFSRKKALFFNFISALWGMAGAIIGYILSEQSESLAAYLLPLAAGGFLYIASSDLIPEIRKHTTFSKMITAFICFLAGIGLMLLVKD